MGGGGVLIETDDEAQQFGRYEVADMQLHVGQELVLEPCVAIPWPDRRACDERPCPLVELDADNAVPAGLTTALLSPRMVPTFGPMFEAEYGTAHGEERKAVLQRVMRAVGSEAVHESEERHREQARAAAQNAATMARARGHHG